MCTIFICFLIGAPILIGTVFATENCTQCSKPIKPTKQFFALTNCPPWDDNMDSITQEQFIEKLTDPCRYDKLIRPHADDDDVLKVSVQMDVKHLEAVDQLAFKTHMWLLYRYTDSRLEYSRLSPHRPTILGQESLREKIWIPHIILRNEKEKAIMGLARKDIFISISPEGEVIYSYRMSATIYCWMNLRKFPFDSQSCDMEMLSWSYNASYLLLEWEQTDPVKIDTELRMTEYTLTSFTTYATVATTNLKPSAFYGNYSLLVFKFNLQREIGFYLITYYIPSIMLVVISWITFYLQADASPPRAVLGTSTMLTFITLSAGQTKTLPKVSYIKFSEIWFLAIAIFIFASLAEFALVNMVWRRRKNVDLKKKTSKHILKSSITPRLARKQFEKARLRKCQSCSNLTKDGSSRTSTPQVYDNYLTVHEFPSLSEIPIIKTESADDVYNNVPSSGATTPARAEETIDVGGGNGENGVDYTTMTPQEVANWIDKRSRVFFPVAFIIFNALYWSFVYAF